jgi:hypothetical protein
MNVIFGRNHTANIHVEKAYSYDLLTVTFSLLITNTNLNA